VGQGQPLTKEYNTSAFDRKTVLKSLQRVVTLCLSQFATIITKLNKYQNGCIQREESMALLFTLMFL
jgi:hypothetical protein